MATFARWGRWSGRRAVGVLVLVPVFAFAFACSGTSDTSPCSSSPKACPGPGASSGGTSGGTSGMNGGMGSEAGAPVGGPLAAITLTPATAMVAVGQLQQFNAVAKDSAGNTPFPYPTLTWSVNGGGKIGDTGLFGATTAGGPFTVTVSGGAISATASVMVTPAVLPTVTIGETAILTNDDSGNADNLLAQQATLANAATLRSLSFYVAAADGNLRLGLYDDTGPDNGPGEKKAETPEFVPKTGWNTVDVVTPVLLPAGDYWLAYAPSSNDLHFELAGDGTGSIAFFANPYGPMPQTFSTTPQTNNDHWSFYATLNP